MRPIVGAQNIARNKRTTNKQINQFRISEAEIPQQKELGNSFLRKQNQLQPGIFSVGGKKLKLDPESFYIFTNRHRLRLLSLKITESRNFERFIILSIIVNSIFLAFYDYSGQNKAKNNLLDLIGDVFSVLFLLEFSLKAISYGLIVHKRSYLREGWNFIDFVIVISGSVELFASGVNLKSLRTIRVLRPLKTISNLPSMRKLVKTLFYSLPELVNVLIFLTFIFTVFSIIGLQTYQGSFYNFCRVTKNPVNATYWPINSEYSDRVCSKDEESGNFKCPQNLTCGSIHDYNLSNKDEFELNPTVQYGIHTFDDFFSSLKTVYQILTKDSWTVILYNLRDQSNPFLSTIFCCSLIVLGSFFLLNLVLAVIMEKFTTVQQFEFQESSKVQEEVWSSEGEEEMSFPSSAQTEREEEVKNSPFRQSSLKKKKTVLSSIEDGNSSIDRSQSFSRTSNMDKSILGRQNTRARKMFGIKVMPLDQSQEEIKEVDEEEEKEMPERVQKSFISLDSYFLGQDDQIQISNQKIDTTNDDVNITQDDLLFDMPTRKKAYSLTKLERKQHLEVPKKKTSFQQKFLEVFQSKLEKENNFKDIAKDNLSSLQILNKVYSKKDLKNQIIEKNQTSLKRGLSKLEIQSPLKTLKTLVAKKIQPKKESSQLSSAQQAKVDLEAKRVANQKEMDRIKGELRKAFLLKKNKDRNLDTDVIGQEVKRQVSKSNSTKGMMKDDLQIQLAIKDKVQQNLEKEKAGQVLLGKLGQHLKSKVTKAADFENKKQLLKQINEDLALLRAQENKLFFFSYQIQKSKWFNIIISTCIVLNTLVLSLDRLNISKEESLSLEALNLAFSVIFLLEMILKQQGLGFKEYFRDRFNAFDSFIVFVSIADLLYTYILNQESTGTGAVTAFRAFRLLRVFKLAKNWKKFQQLLETIGKSLQDISTFSVLLAIFVYTYTLIGMEFLAYKLKFDQDGRYSTSGENPQSTFNTFFEAFYSVFIVLANDGWTTIYFDVYRAYNSSFAVFYFFSLLTLGQFLLLNIFLAILVSNFDEDSYNQASINEGQSQISVSFFSRIQIEVKKILSKVLSNKVYSQKTLKEESNKSLYIFKENNQLRIFCGRTAESKVFTGVIIFAILVSSVQLALENPLSSPQGRLSSSLEIIEIVTSIIFFFEAALKIIQLGFLLNGDQSYLRQYQNQLDFLIVLLSIFSLSSEYDVAAIKVLRLFRVLKPLRIISRSDGLKLSIQSLLSSIPSILNVLVICSLFFLIFGIIGVSILKGSKFDCKTSYLDHLGKENQIKVKNKWECLNCGGLWINMFYNFDDILNATLTLFTMAVTVGWQQQLYQGVSFRGFDKAPQDNYNLPLGLFFVFFMIVGSFFILNLFVGIVISNFNREKELIGKDFMLTKSQKRWVETKLLIIKAQPKLLEMPPNNFISKTCFYICKHPFFDSFIYFIILLNTLFLALSWRGQSQQVASWLENINYFFQVLFTIEAIVKILGIRQNYFKEKWNIFDFSIVIGTYIGIILSSIFGFSFGAQTSVLRTFRVGRVFRLLKRNKSLKQIFQTFIISLPGLSNVGFLLMLFLYIYSVLGVGLFAQVKLNGLLNEQANFQTTSMAMLTLFRISTGENWHLIIEALSKEQELDFSCKESPSYQEYQENDYKTLGCGNRFTAIAFFLSFITIVTLVFLNLFIAIILQSFEDIIQSDRQIFNPLMTEFFKNSWSKFDPEASGFIKTQDLPALMFDLDEPLGWPQDFAQIKQQNFIEKLNLKKYKIGSCYFFTDVLENLAFLLVVKAEYMKIQPRRSLKKKSSHLSEIEVLPQNSIGYATSQEQNVFENLKQTIKSSEKRRESRMVQNLDKQFQNRVLKPQITMRTQKNAIQSLLVGKIKSQTEESEKQQQSIQEEDEESKDSIETESQSSVRSQIQVQPSLQTQTPEAGRKTSLMRQKSSAVDKIEISSGKASYDTQKSIRKQTEPKVIMMQLESFQPVQEEESNLTSDLHALSQNGQGLSQQQSQALPRSSFKLTKEQEENKQLDQVLREVEYFMKEEMASEEQSSVKRGDTLERQIQDVERI